jgi:hypothetical protein
MTIDRVEVRLVSDMKHDDRYTGRVRPNYPVITR